jgi:hypothetical protein
VSRVFREEISSNGVKLRVEGRGEVSKENGRWSLREGDEQLGRMRNGREQRERGFDGENLRTKLELD